MQRREIVELSAAANQEIYSDPQVEAASERWIRLGSGDVQKFHDGLTIDTFGLSPFMTSLAKAVPTSMLQKMVARGQMHGYAERMMTLPLIGFIAVRDRYSRAHCLNAGRGWQRLHLLATARGIAAPPSNELSERVITNGCWGSPRSGSLRVAMAFVRMTASQAAETDAVRHIGGLPGMKPRSVGKLMGTEKGIAFEAGGAVKFVDADQIVSCRLTTTAS